MVMSDECWSLSLAHHYRITDRGNNWILNGLFLPRRNSPGGLIPTHYRGFVITLRRTTLCRALLDDCSARRRPLHYNTQHSQETNINDPAAFEPSIPAIERPKTHALYRAATGRIFNDQLTKSQRKPTAIRGVDIVRQRPQKRTCAKNSKRKLASKDKKVKVPRVEA